MLTSEQRSLREWCIGNRYAQGGITRKELAVAFGVSVSTVNRALGGLDWPAIRTERSANDDDNRRDMQQWGEVAVCHANQ